jgi:hypothetical protein
VKELLCQVVVCALLMCTSSCHRTPSGSSFPTPANSRAARASQAGNQRDAGGHQPSASLATPDAPPIVQGATSETSQSQAKRPTGTIKGVALNLKDFRPVRGIPVHLGFFDGKIIEISLQHSPVTVTDENGLFCFSNIAPSSSGSRYAFGIILADVGLIGKDISGNRETMIVLNAGEQLDVGNIFFEMP